MPSKVAAGYSGTPLAKKLGIGEGARVLVVDAPEDYDELVAPLPPGVTRTVRLDAKTDVVHLFTRSKAHLAKSLAGYRAGMRPDCAIWVSWPKKASGVATDVTEDVIRAVALPRGLVDVKVCAVSEVWSGLKLVVPVKDRPKAAVKKPSKIAKSAQTEARARRATRASARSAAARRAPNQASKRAR